MQLGPDQDPALDAATRALSGRAEGRERRFASIELRSVDSKMSALAPLGYLATVVVAVGIILLLWFL